MQKVVRRGLFFPCSVLLVCLLLLFVCPSTLSAQHWSARVGVQAAWGYPVTRLGLLLEAALHHNVAELRAGCRWHWQFRRYGPPLQGLELNPYAAIWLGYGPAGTEQTWFPHPAFDQLNTQYSLGYQIHYYADRAETSQWTGALAFRFGQFALRIDNDALVPGKPRDRFRTGGFQFAWREGDWIGELSILLWHGDTKCEWVCKENDPNFPCRWGYRDFTDCRYGKYSHGVMQARVHRLLPYHQTTQLSLGVDSEHVRNVFQNRLVHDMWWFPSAWTPVRNPHYPMLDTYGAPYLGLPGQELRRARLVWGLGLNQEHGY